jgi:predicted nucleic acid-binding protein
LILVDTSVWVEHLRIGRPDLARLLDDGLALGHPWVAGELAMGQLVRRAEIIGLLGALPPAIVATPEEILVLVEHHQLLASTALTDGASLWTTDRRLEAAAVRVGCARI